MTLYMYVRLIKTLMRVKMYFEHSYPYPILSLPIPNTVFTMSNNGYCENTMEHHADEVIGINFDETIIIYTTVT